MSGRGRAVRVHASGAVVAGALVAVAFLAIEAPSVRAQLVGCALLIGAFGLPHGALDLHRAGEALRPALGRRWLPVFVTLYLGVALGVVALWILQPVASLAAFLVVSAFHFGAGDRAALPGSQHSWIEIALRGALPIVAPIVLHPEESARLLGWLLPREAAEGFVPSFVAAASVARPFAIGTALAGVVALLVAGGRQRGRVALEVGVLGALYALGPPLVAFTLYFCVWHAPRHVLAVLGESDLQRVQSPGRVLRQVGPPTLAAAMLGAIGFVLLAGSVPPETALARVLFVGLAALTAPHMMFEAWRAARRRHLILRTEWGIHPKDRERPWTRSGSSAIS